MSEHDRLVELLNDSQNHCATIEFCDGCIGMGKGYSCFNHYQADYLLANGVIVPPCKIGDMVYVIPTKDNGLEEVTEMRVLGFAIGTPCNVANCFRVRGTSALYQPSFEQFGKTVFLTREEAVAVLAERRKE